jgi:hypothetical protein
MLLPLGIACSPLIHAEALDDSCPSSPEPREYQQREGTRCEGFKIPAFTAAAPAIVAVTIKTEDASASRLPTVLDIRVPASTQLAGSHSADLASAVRSELVIRDYRYGYWADRFKMEKQGGYWSFGWPTDLLTRFKVPLFQLHARATDFNGRFAPVRLAPASGATTLHYEFAIVSLSKLLRLASFSICVDPNRACTAANSLYHEAGSQDIPFSSDLIVVKWNGMMPDGRTLPARLLRVEVRTEVDGPGSSVETGSIALFLHDPNLLK